MGRYGLAVDVMGSVYVVAGDDGAAVAFGRPLRRISPDGVIARIGGKSGGEDGSGHPSQGKPVTDVPLFTVVQMQFGADEALYVADSKYGIRSFSALLGSPKSATGAPTTDAGTNCLGPRVFVPDAAAGLIYEFNTEGRHCATLDRFGTQLLVFSFQGTPLRLAKVTDVLGHSTVITRDVSGVALEVTGPFGHKTSLTEVGGVLSVTNPNFETYDLTFDGGGLLKKFKTPRSKEHTFEYELPTPTTPGGRLRTDTLPGGLGGVTLARATTSTGWSVSLKNLEGGVSLRTNARWSGLVTQSEVSSDGIELVSEQRPDGTTVQKLPADGTLGGAAVLLTSKVVSDPDFGIQSALADTALAIPGRPSESWSAIEVQTKSTIERTLEISGAPTTAVQLQTTTTVSGTVSGGTDLAASGGTLQTKIKRFLATDTPPVAGAAFEVTTVTGAGRITINYLDAALRVLRTKVPSTLLPAPLDVVTTYDDDTDPAASGSATGFPRKVTQGTRAISFVYDPATGFPKRLNGPEGMSTQLDSVDPVGRVLSATYPGGQVVGTLYDLAGNLSSVTPPLRSAHTFEWDDDDRAHKSLAPALTPGKVTASTLDRYLDGLPKVVTSPTATLTFLRDTTTTTGGSTPGRIVEIKDGKVPAESVKLNYSTVTGAVNSLSKALPDRGLAFTRQGPLLRSITSTGLVPATVSYFYDARLRPARETVSGLGYAAEASAPIEIAYDADGEATKVGEIVHTFESSNPRRLIGMSMGSFITDALTRNGYGEVATWTTVWGAGSSAGTFSYNLQATPRDNLGRIVTKSETVYGVTTAYGYRYDSAGRLWQVYEGSTLAATYLYGPNGNRISKATLDATWTIDGAVDIDPQDRLLKWGDLKYQYSESGELETATSISTGDLTKYGYDGSGELLFATLHAGSTSPPERKIEYVLDPAGNPIVRKVNGSVTDQYFWVGGRILLHKSGSIVTRFVYGSHANVPDYVVRGATKYRVVVDHLGSVRAVVSAETVPRVVQRMKYDEFGVVKVDTKLDGSGFDGVPLPMGYAGGYYDRDTGLVRFGARWYDAATGRWISKDPIGLGGGLNLYAYVANDPINETDVLGLSLDSLSAACRNPGQAAICLSLLSNAGDKIITNVGAKAGQFGGYCASQVAQNANTAVSWIRESGTRLLTARDLGLGIGRGLTALRGSVTNVGNVRIIHVDMIEGRMTAREAMQALPSIVGAAQAQGVEVLQLTGTLANDRLLRVMSVQGQRLGAMMASSNGGESFTFLLGKH